MRYNNGLIDCNGVAAMMRPLISGGYAPSITSHRYTQSETGLSDFFYASGKPGLFHLLRKGGAKTMKKNEIVLFETVDNEVSLQVQMSDETVWLTRNQMAELFDRDVKTIGKHINNALREELCDSVVAKFATTAADGKTYQTEHYDLDMIISVGYRVKSQRGVEFRRWANSVLKDYILRGYAVNEKRINQLGQMVQIMKRAENQLDAQQVLSVVPSYNWYFWLCTECVTFLEQL